MSTEKEQYEKHRIEQVLRWATESTPAERLQFVEDALELFHKAGYDYQKIKRAKKSSPTSVS